MSLSAFDDRISAFCSYLKDVRGASEHTVKAYAEDLTQLAAWAMCAPDAVTPEKARAWIAHLTTERGLARASVARKAASLRAFYRWLARRGTVKSSPAEGLTIPKKRRPLP